MNKFKHKASDISITSSKVKSENVNAALEEIYDNAVKIPADYNNRLTEIENQQHRTYMDFREDFDTTKNLDLSKTNALITGGKVIAPRTITDNITTLNSHNNFDMNEIESIGVNIVDEKLISDNLYGIYYSQPVNIKDAYKVRVTMNDVKPSYTSSCNYKVLESASNASSFYGANNLIINNNNEKIYIEATNNTTLFVTVYNEDWSIKTSFSATISPTNNNYFLYSLNVKSNDKYIYISASKKYSTSTYDSVEVNIYKIDKNNPTGILARTSRTIYNCSTGLEYKIELCEDMIVLAARGNGQYRNIQIFIFDSSTLELKRTLTVEDLFGITSSYSCGTEIFELFKTKKGLVYLTKVHDNNSISWCELSKEAHIEGSLSLNVTSSGSVSMIHDKYGNSIEPMLTEKSIDIPYTQSVETNMATGSRVIDNQIFFYSLASSDSNKKLVVAKFIYDENDDLSPIKFEKINTFKTNFEMTPRLSAYRGDTNIYLDKDKSFMYLVYPVTENGYIYNCFRIIDFELNDITGESIINGDDYITSTSYGSCASIGIDRNTKEPIILLKQRYGKLNYSSNNVITSYGISIVESQIRYSYKLSSSDDWLEINDNLLELEQDSFDNIYIKAELSTFNIEYKPYISSINIEHWKFDEDKINTSYLYSKRLPAVNSSGKAMIISDQSQNDGEINWFVTYNGGADWNSINLNEEFAYNYTSTPDFRIKAELNYNSKYPNPPEIRDYTLRTNSLVMHSDLEEIKINLMKTNFKIDSFSNATANGLIKMYIDVFNDTLNINEAESSYSYSNSKKEVTGSHVVSRARTIENTMTSILLTVDEILLDDTQYIEYFVSRDGGQNYIPIVPNVKTMIPTIKKAKCDVVFKAVFYNGASLSAWAWCWD